MGRQIAKGLTMLMLLLTMALVTAVATANGQSQHKLNARIPFEFIVGDKTLAAGQYEVNAVGITTGSAGDPRTRIKRQCDSADDDQRAEREQARETSVSSLR